MFNVGDLAVYPAQGVGIIEAIEYREVMGSNQMFYIMQILGNGMKIMIPTDSAASVGLREIIPAEEIPKVYAILRNKDVSIDRQTWNKRYRDYLEKIKTGSVFEIASVLRDLFILKVDKNLSFGERKMMDTAKSLLVKENMGYSVPFAFIKFEQTDDLVKIPVTDYDLEKVRQTIAEINQIVQREAVPEPTPYVKRCKDCGYRKICRRA